MDAIQAIQNLNIYRVNPIGANQRDSGSAPNMFESGLFAQPKLGEHNLNYPKVKGSETQGRSLDLLA